MAASSQKHRGPVGSVAAGFQRLIPDLRGGILQTPWLNKALHRTAQKSAPPVILFVSTELLQTEVFEFPEFRTYVSAR
jgi:hypothetical protein